jgi:hypothetical protein
VSPRARRTLLEGVPCWATLVGRGGHRSVGLCCVRMFCVMFEVCLCFVFFAGFKQDSPGFLGDPCGYPRQILYWFGPPESKTLRPVLKFVLLVWRDYMTTCPREDALAHIILGDEQGRWTGVQISYNRETYL